MDISLSEGLARALATHCTPDRVRAIEAGEDPRDLWQIAETLGYGDAFVAADDGGIGLALPDAFELARTLGQAGFPLPLLETAIARALLARAGCERPAGAIVLCDATRGANGDVSVPQTPGLRVAAHALLRHEDAWHLLALDPNLVLAGTYRPRISGALERVDLREARCRFDAPRAAAQLTAPIHAAEMAGSMAAVLEMTVAYAGARRQFGRPIGQFQALQQEISVLAEQVALATTAARLGCAGPVDAPDALRGAGAKLTASEAAAQAVAIAHAVHGAIGITEDYALGMHARRLHEWRGAGASATECARMIGDALRGHGGSTLEFVRAALSAA